MHWKLLHTIGVLILIALFFVAATFSGRVLSLFGLEPTSATALWIEFMALMAITIVLIGHGVTGVFDGLLIDSRNKMSLSRVQVLLWTTLILPAFLAATVFNFGVGAEDPINIVVPPEVWGLLGISNGSLVGAAIIKSGRDEIVSDQVDPQLDEATADPKSAAAVADVNNLEVTNPEPEQASVSDLFKGELVGSQEYLEVGKVQMFFFTLLVVFAYGNVIAASFNKAGETGEAIVTLPVLSAGMLALLAISHAGYLANKTVTAAPANPPVP